MRKGKTRNSKPKTRNCLKKLYVIGGATATGKTAAAIELAQQLGTEILSADSRQFYRGMDIGTAKPTPEELAAVRHHFIDSLDVTQPYSAGDFERDALRLLARLFEKYDSAVLVGGSGLFLRAVCEGLDDFPVISPETQNRVEALEKTGGLAALQAEVGRLDPVQFAQMDTQNPARLRRVLRVCLESGQPYSTFLAAKKQPRPFTPIYILKELPRPELYARINARVDAMVAAGLEEEARRFLPYRDLPALQTVGYAEWFDFFEGKTSRAEAIEKIKQHTRNYAKRQHTWFRQWEGMRIEG